MKRFKNIFVDVFTQLEEQSALPLAVRLDEHRHAKLKFVDVVTLPKEKREARP